MRKHRLLIAVSMLSVAALATTPLTHAREIQPGDDRGKREVQMNDDRGVDFTYDIARGGDDNGVDPAPHARGGDNGADDNGVDPAPHARGGDNGADDNGVDPAPHA